MALNVYIKDPADSTVKKAAIPYFTPNTANAETVNYNAYFNSAKVWHYIQPEIPSGWKNSPYYDKRAVMLLYRTYIEDGQTLTIPLVGNSRSGVALAYNWTVYYYRSDFNGNLYDSSTEVTRYGDMSGQQTSASTFRSINIRTEYAGYYVVCIVPQGAYNPGWAAAFGWSETYNGDNSLVKVYNLDAIATYPNAVQDGNIVRYGNDYMRDLFIGCSRLQLYQDIITKELRQSTTTSADYFMSSTFRTAGTDTFDSAPLKVVMPQITLYNTGNSASYFMFRTFQGSSIEEPIKVTFAEPIFGGYLYDFMEYTYADTPKLTSPDTTVYKFKGTTPSGFLAYKYTNATALRKPEDELAQVQYAGDFSPTTRHSLYLYMAYMYYNCTTMSTASNEVEIPMPADSSEIDARYFRFRQYSGCTRMAVFLHNESTSPLKDFPTAYIDSYADRHTAAPSVFRYQQFYNCPQFSGHSSFPVYNNIFYLPYSFKVWVITSPNVGATSTDLYGSFFALPSETDENNVTLYVNNADGSTISLPYNVTWHENNNNGANCIRNRSQSVNMYTGFPAKVK